MSEVAVKLQNITNEMTTKYFNTQLMPPKSATTMLTTTQHQPLVDTKRLSLSITYRVEGGGGA